MKKAMPSRRTFLIGAGGFTLSLPFLPSLLDPGLSKEAKAQSRPDPFFVAMATQHGGVRPWSMYPGDATLTSTFDYAGRTCRRGSLSGQAGGGWTALSPVLSGPSARLTPSLIAQMNVIRGLDIPFYIAHHTGGHLGNYARNDGNGGEGVAVQGSPRRTIDQVMAYSPNFYRDITGVTERALAIGARGMSWGYASPSTGTGDIQQIYNYTSNQALFTRLFTPGEGEGSPSPLVVDRVLENLNRLRDGNRRLSSADRRRLDEHMERLFELERRVNLSPSCGEVGAPAVDSDELRRETNYSIDPDSMVAFWQLQNDIIAAAIGCGVCRIFSMNASETFSTFEGDWHQDVAHQAHAVEGGTQEILMQAHQVFFEGVYLDLISKLDGVEGPEGESILKDGLVMWTQESGMVTHQSYSIPVITAGSAGGAMNTGRYVDVRNVAIPYNYYDDLGQPLPYNDNPGLMYNQWLGTILRSMGLENKEFEEENAGGYGVFYISDGVEEDYVEAAGVLSEDVPV